MLNARLSLPPFSLFLVALTLTDGAFITLCLVCGRTLQTNSLLI